MNYDYGQQQYLHDHEQNSKFLWLIHDQNPWKMLIDVMVWPVLVATGRQLLLLIIIMKIKITTTTKSSSLLIVFLNGALGKLMFLLIKWLYFFLTIPNYRKKSLFEGNSRNLEKG